MINVKNKGIDSFFRNLSQGTKRLYKNVKSQFKRFFRRRKISEELLFPLSPKSDLQKKDPQFAVYQKYLQKAFRNRNIKNIAVSGNLGSGKSSIIRSFDRSRNGKEKFLYISLIDFVRKQDISNGANPINPNDRKGGKLSAEKLANSFLAQVTARCRPGELPQKSLELIPEKGNKAMLLAAAVTLLFGQVFMLLFPEPFGTIARSLRIPDSLNAYVHDVLYITACLTSALILYGICSTLFSSLLINSITLKNDHAAAEMKIKSALPALDANQLALVCALYSLRKKVDRTVVFEDLDRLHNECSSELLDMLRDTNDLVNTYCSEREFFPKQYRFIYALSDNLFAADMRVKFYDFILPIIPIVNHHNSNVLLADILRGFGIKRNQREKWEAISKLSVFLTDNRMLRDFQNEFMVYRDIYVANLNPQKKSGKRKVSQPLQNNSSMQLSQDELLTIAGIVIYKTLFPSKFASMFAADGYASLQMVTKEDCDITGVSDAYKDNLINGINNLFEAGVIYPFSLEMIGNTKSNILMHWKRVSQNGTRNEQIKLLNEITLPNNHLVENTPQMMFAEYLFENNWMANYSDKSLLFAYFDFLYNISASSKKVKNITGIKCDTELMQRFCNAVNLNDVVLPKPGRNSLQHFTNLYRLLSERPELWGLVKKAPGWKVVFWWSIWILYKMQPSDLLAYSWNSEMGKVLKSVLFTYSNEVPESVWTCEVTKKKCIRDFSQTPLFNGQKNIENSTP